MDGIPYSEDEEMHHFLTAPLTVDLWITDENYETFPNVQRVMSNIS